MLTTRLSPVHKIACLPITHFSALSFLYTTLLSGEAPHLLTCSSRHSPIAHSSVQPHMPIPSFWLSYLRRHLDSHLPMLMADPLSTVITCFLGQWHHILSRPQGPTWRGRCKENGVGDINTAWWPTRRRKPGEPVTECHFLPSSGGRERLAVVCSFFLNYFNSLGRDITWSAFTVIGSTDVWKFSLVVIFHTDFF